ncbi:MAG: autotransporter-associated beta strand repeat-containing protein [Verrucomicrobia bacterium]|nr:autotransporter-associated beta strand repeat-containing protein [Verrucomicrobiota bacterium]
MSSRIVALTVSAASALSPAAQATIATFAEYHLGETGSLGANNLPLDGSGNGRHLTSPINGGYTSVGSAAFHSLAANSTAYLDTSLTGGEGFYSTNLFASLPTDNFAFGVFARAASMSGTQGDVFTLGGSNGAFKLSLASNGWASSAHNAAWIGSSGGISGSFTADTWVHLAMIRAGGTTTFYINGIAQGSTYAGAPAHNTPHLSVDPGGSNYFDGQIDEARVLTFDPGDTTADILAALQVGSRIPDHFTNAGTKGAYYAAALSTDQSSSFRIGGGTNDFVKITLPDRLSVIAGTAPTQVIDIVKQGTIAVGTYPLIDYEGSIGGLGFAGLSLGALPSRVAATLVHNTTNSTIDLDVTVSGEDHITWTGTGGGTWDMETTAAWKFDTGGASTVFYDTDQVTFDDTAMTGTVTIFGSVQPASVTVNNATLDYTFTGDSIAGPTGLVKSGSAGLTVSNYNAYTGANTLNAGTVRLEGANGSLGTGAIVNNAALIVERDAVSTMSNPISGSGTLEKRGTETLTLSGTSTYSGATTISAGTLKSGNTACLGSASGSTTVADGATLDVNSIGFGSEPIIINGTGVGGAGAIINSGSERQYGVLNLTLASDSAIGGTGRWDLRGTGATASGNFKLTKVGTNHTSFVSTTMDIKDIDLMEGTLAFEYGTTYADTHPGRVAAATGSVIGFGNHGWAITMSKPLQMDGGKIRTTSTGSNGNCTVISPVALNAASTEILVDSAATMNLDGVLSGTGGIEKTGTGTLSLGAANSYTGNTTVTLGTLTLTTDSLADTAGVSIATGATLNLTHTATDTLGTLFVGGVQQAAGLYKSAAAEGPGTVLSELTGTGKLQVTTGPANTFASWMAGYDFSAFPGADLSATGDADQDGIDNLVEQVFGTAPNAATAGLTRVSATSTSVTFNHHLNPNLASDVTYSYQWSTGLGEWKASGESDTGGTTATIAAGAPVADEVTVTATISAGPATRLFIRVVAVQGP